MPKKMENTKITVSNIYNGNGKTLTELTQGWLNEIYFFGNLNNDKNEIKYRSINK